jgi:hypothetical protein
MLIKRCFPVGRFNWSGDVRWRAIVQILKWSSPIVYALNVHSQKLHCLRPGEFFIGRIFKALRWTFSKSKFIAGLVFTCIGYEHWFIHCLNSRFIIFIFSCGSGCYNCVWIQYADAVHKYFDDHPCIERTPRKWQKIHDLLGRNVPDVNLRAYLEMEMKHKFFHWSNFCLSIKFYASLIGISLSIFDLGILGFYRWFY